jgi:hypothetical protein
MFMLQVSGNPRIASVGSETSIQFLEVLFQRLRNFTLAESCS